MLNLLKSDLDRLAHGKMLWVLLALMSAVVALTIAGSWFVGTDTFRAMTKKNANANSQASVSFSVSNNNNNIDEAALDEIQAQATTTSGLTTVAGGTAFGMGFILLLNGLFTALFLSSDHKSGFEKTMLAAQRNRGVY